MGIKDLVTVKVDSDEHSLIAGKLALRNESPSQRIAKNEATVGANNNQYSPGRVAAYES